MEKSGKAAAVIIVLAFLVAFCFGAYTDWTFKLEEKPAGGGPEPTGEWLGGTYTITVKGLDSLDTSTTYTTGTNFASSWYAYRSGTYVFLTSGSASPSEGNIESEADDDGYVWLLTEEKSGQHYYIDAVYTVAKNTYITDYRWVDADGDTEKEFVFECSLWNIPDAASGYPKRTFNVYLYDESGADTHANAFAFPTGGKPSDITAGTSTVTKYIAWYGELSAEKTAVAIYRIMIEVNTTETTKFSIEKFNIPGVGYLDGSLLDETILTSKVQYIYDIYVTAVDFNEVTYWKIASGTNNKIDLTVSVKTTLGASDIFEFKLYVYQLYCDRTTASDNDAVLLSGS